MIDAPHTALTDAELINLLRRAASIWFKNSDLLLLEEFIKRFNCREQEPTAAMIKAGLRDEEGFNLLGITERDLREAYMRMVAAGSKTA